MKFDMLCVLTTTLSQGTCSSCSMLLPMPTNDTFPGSAVAAAAAALRVQNVPRSTTSSPCVRLPSATAAAAAEAEACSEKCADEACPLRLLLEVSTARRSKC